MILRLLSAAFALLLGAPRKRETPEVPAVQLAEELSLITDDEVTEWMPRLDIDLRDHTVIETVECADCGFLESFVCTMADERHSACPKCKSRAVFLSASYGDTKKPIPPFQPVSVFDRPEDWTPEMDDDDTEPLF